VDDFWRSSIKAWVNGVKFGLPSAELKKTVFLQVLAQNARAVRISAHAQSAASRPLDDTYCHFIS